MHVAVGRGHVGVEMAKYGGVLMVVVVGVMNRVCGVMFEGGLVFCELLMEDDFGRDFWRE